MTAKELHNLDSASVKVRLGDKDLGHGTVSVPECAIARIYICHGYVSIIAEAMYLDFDGETLKVKVWE